MSRKRALSRIYFDDIPVRLLADEVRPPLDRIVRAGGKVPGRVDVVVLTSPRDRTGAALPPGEVIDRTVEPAKPIYLRSIPRADAKKADARTASAPPGTAAAGVAVPTPTADVDPVIAQLGRDPELRAARRSAQDRVQRAEALAAAESEAHERQEEDREQDGYLQDEQEDQRQADVDGDAQE